MELKRFEYIATLAFDAYTEEEADQMLKDELEEGESGFDYEWELDPICDGAQDRYLEDEDLEDEEQHKILILCLTYN